MELVSVIVPIYNVEKYIEKCLKSIINQSYRNLEILLINDGTTDNSMEIVKKYINDKRIKIINQKNQGVSEARNNGLKNATGNYIMFVDSDDWLDFNCIEKCLNFLKEYELEVVLFPRKNEYIQSSIKKEQFFKTTILENKLEVEKKILRRYFGLYNNELKRCLSIEELNPVWGKLYKRKVIANVRFKDINIIGSEDCVFNMEVFFSVKKAGYIEEVFYHYRKSNVESITRSYKKDLYEQFKNMYKIMENYIKIKKLSKDFEIALTNRKIINIFSFIFNICSSNLKFKKKLKEIEKILNDDLYKELFKNFKFKYLNWKWYIFYKLCYYKMGLTILLIMCLILKIKEKGKQK